MVVMMVVMAVMVVVVDMMVVAMGVIMTMGVMVENNNKDNQQFTTIPNTIMQYNKLQYNTIQ